MDDEAETRRREGVLRELAEKAERDAPGSVDARLARLEWHLFSVQAAVIRCGASVERLSRLVGMRW